MPVPRVRLEKTEQLSNICVYTPQEYTNRGGGKRTCMKVSYMRWTAVLLDQILNS